MKTKLMLGLLMAACFLSHAQTRSKKTSSSTTPKNWGIGLRLGDPLGVTLKKYLVNGRALEFNLGSSSSWGYDYRHHFYDDNKYRNAQYLGYHRNNAVSFQAHYLFQKPFPNAKGLSWYWGIGAQLRVKRYEFYYRYDAGNAWIYQEDKVTNVDIGADGIIGLEYDIPKAPLSIFADANLFLEIADDPFDLFGQGGIGIRYNF
jgi:hypothetical protein